MTLTRKDYNLIAGALKEIRENTETSFGSYSESVCFDLALDRTISLLADHFENDNPRFDRNRFVGACS